MPRITETRKKILADSRYCLSPRQLSELTGATYTKVQRRFLDENGFGYAQRGDGSIALTHKEVAAVLAKRRRQAAA